VLRPHRRQRTQDNQVQRSLQQFHAITSCTRHSSGVGVERAFHEATGVSSGEGRRLERCDRCAGVALWTGAHAFRPTCVIWGFSLCKSYVAAGLQPCKSVEFTRAGGSHESLAHRRCEPTWADARRHRRVPRSSHRESPDRGAGPLRLSMESAPAASRRAP
jgi:hypothetical protein